MKDKVCYIYFDQSERGAVISALDQLRQKRVNEGKTNELIDSLLIRIKNAPFKTTRVQDVTSR